MNRPSPRRDARLTVAAAALAALVVLALFSQLLDDGTAPDRRATDGSPAPAPPRTLADRRDGYTAAHPGDWRVERGRAVTRIVSPRRSVVIAVSTPTSGRFPRTVARDALRALLESYRPARVVGRSPARLGRFPVTGTEIDGRDRAGRPIRIVSLAAASRWRTYAVAVFASTPPDTARLRQARPILGSFRFTRPAHGRRRSAS